MFLIFIIFQYEKVKNMAYQAIINAKRLAKEGVLNSGKEQEDFAVLRFYPYLPGKIKFFISENTFRKIIRWLYKQATDYLDDGKFNNSNGGKT